MEHQFTPAELEVIAEGASHITIESPFPPHAYPRVWQWAKKFGLHQITDDFGPKDQESFEGALAAYPGDTWGVYRDGILGGMISATKESECVAVAHMLFKQSFFGYATTVPAGRMVFDAIFKSGIRRIEGTPFEENQSMIKLAYAFGFEREGTLRSRTMSKGRPRSMVMMGLLAEDFYRKIGQEQPECLSLPQPPSSPDLSPQAEPPQPTDSPTDPPPPKALPDENES
jgi:hypothetical protein